MVSMVEIGERIKVLRDKKEITQKEMADALNVKRETVNAWENGLRDIKTEYTAALADFFGVSCDRIIRGIDAENADAYNRTGLSENAIENLSSLWNNDISFSDDGGAYNNYPAYLHHKLLNYFIEDVKTTAFLSIYAGEMIKLKRNEETDTRLKEGGIYFEIHRIMSSFLDDFCDKFGDELFREYLLFMNAFVNKGSVNDAKKE